MKMTMRWYGTGYDTLIHTLIRDHVNVPQQDVVLFVKHRRNAVGLSLRQDSKPFPSLVAHVDFFLTQIPHLRFRHIYDFYQTEIPPKGRRIYFANRLLFCQNAWPFPIT